MKKTLLANWSLMRILRVVVGVMAIVQSITNKDVTVGLIGGFLLFTGIANIGCCCSASCSIPPQKESGLTKIEYEELDKR
jgi:uncharacterized membrane protein HdeD (DUF308 family)